MNDVIRILEFAVNYVDSLTQAFL